MKYAFLLSFVLLCAIGISGCYTLNAVGTPADAPFSMSNNPSGSVVKHFSIKMTVHHFIAGLVVAGDPDVAKALSDEVKASGGSGAINVKLHYQMTFVNGLVNMITASIYNPFTLTIEGDVIK